MGQGSSLVCCFFLTERFTARCCFCLQVEDSLNLNPTYASRAGRPSHRWERNSFTSVAESKVDKGARVPAYTAIEIPGIRWREMRHTREKFWTGDDSSKIPEKSSYFLYENNLSITAEFDPKVSSFPIFFSLRCGCFPTVLPGSARFGERR